MKLESQNNKIEEQEVKPEFQEDSRNKKLKEWLKKFICKFRQAYEKLEDSEKSRIVNQHDYKYPCQIEIFWMNNPVEYQIMVITHNPKREDQEIIINGLYKGDEFLDSIDKIMLKERWQEPLEDQSIYHNPNLEKITYSDIFSGIVNTFITSIKNSLLFNNKEGFQGGQILTQNSWVWCIKGNLCNLDCDKIIEEIIKEIRNNAKIWLQESKIEKSFEKPNLLRGYGTFAYPPIWIGKIPKKTFKQIALGDNYLWRSKVFDAEISKTKIIINSDGFIGVLKDNKQETMNIINLIFGMSILFGIDCLAIRESEITEIGAEPKLLSITSTVTPMNSLRNILTDSSRPQLNYYPKTEIPEEIFKEIIKKADIISSNQKITEQLTFLLEGYTHYKNAEYSQSFIINWVIIERYLFKIWRELLEEKNISEKRKSKLNDSNRWSADYILEVLNIQGKIDGEDYILFMDLKDKRNKLIHKGEQIDKSTSEKLLNLVFNMIKKEVLIFIQERAKNETTNTNK